MTCPNSQWFMEGRTAVMASKGVPKGQFCRRLLKSMHCLRMCGTSPIHFPDVLVFRSPGFQLNDGFRGKLEARICMSTRIREKAMQVIIIKIPPTAKKTAKNLPPYQELVFQAHQGISVCNLRLGLLMYWRKIHDTGLFTMSRIWWYQGLCVNMLHSVPSVHVLPWEKAIMLHLPLQTCALLHYITDKFISPFPL